MAPPPADPVPVELPAAPVDPSDPDADPPAPVCQPVAPVAPTPSWATAPLPAGGTVFSSPDARGLTGLESRFWWSGPSALTWTVTGSAGVAADCSIVPGITRTFTAGVAQLEWDLGETVITSVAAGTPEEPAVRHTYQTKGADYVVSVDKVWVGSPPGVVVTPGGSKPHPVIEVRSVLTD